METTFHRQQGDVIARGVGALPATARRCTPRPIAVGEGHHEHVLVADAPEAPAVEFYEDADGTLYTVLATPGTLRHQAIGGGAGEHGPVAIPAGVTQWGRVHEWDPWAEGERIRQVQD